MSGYLRIAFRFGVKQSSPPSYRYRLPTNRFFASTPYSRPDSTESAPSRTFTCMSDAKRDRAVKLQATLRCRDEDLLRARAYDDQTCEVNTMDEIARPTPIPPANEQTPVWTGPSPHADRVHGLPHVSQSLSLYHFSPLIPVTSAVKHPDVVNPKPFAQVLWLHERCYMSSGRDGPEAAEGTVVTNKQRSSCFAGYWRRPLK